MKREEFEDCLHRQSSLLERIRLAAHELHEHVNQHYSGNLPYGYHLDAVAACVREFGHEVCMEATDVVPLVFSAYYHDSIEDARLTYNDVMRHAQTAGGMEEEKARLATEIVYALTNEKGRNRAERANEKYYAGIRQTPYAPFVKASDRLANMRYSFRLTSPSNIRMMKVYAGEWEHFIRSIRGNDDDVRLSVPDSLVGQIEGLIKGVGAL
ncbi:MAG: hypothetical protein K2N13_05920 [Paraprevotella sp.]|nr:hypothetical protein [Paraprevotella sp.]